MKVRQYMSHPVITCTPADSLHEAARRMWDHDCGALPVVDEAGRVVGMLTDRDICMAAFTQGQPLLAMRTASAMTSQVRCCGPEDTLEHAEDLMREHQIRRVPVVDEGGVLVGILSLNDIARAAARDRGRKTGALSAARITATLASICAPRTSSAATA